MGDKSRILLVDDEQAVLDGLTRQHRKHYECVTACGGHAALELLQRDPTSASS
ncbi:MAG: hypothetical protein R3F17_05645 [Planctomycetota bacterium]